MRHSSRPVLPQSGLNVGGSLHQLAFLDCSEDVTVDAAATQLPDLAVCAVAELMSRHAVLAASSYRTLANKSEFLALGIKASVGASLATHTPPHKTL
eukprot:4632505-Amphidinium_carterae.1